MPLPVVRAPASAGQVKERWGLCDKADGRVTQTEPTVLAIGSWESALLQLCELFLF